MLAFILRCVVLSVHLKVKNVCVDISNNVDQRERNKGKERKENQSGKKKWLALQLRNQEVPVQIAARRPAILANVFHCFLTSASQNAGIVH
jgi:hypothetical protein